MRRWLLLLVMVLGGGAQANPSVKGVEDAVRGNVVGLASLANNPRLTKDAVVVLPSFELADLGGDKCTPGLADAFYGCYLGSVTHTLGKVIAVADDARGLGWFQADYTAKTVDDEDGGTTRSAMRIGGIAVRVGTTWSLARATYARPIADKTLLDRVEIWRKTPPKLAGDRAIAEALAGWLPGKLVAGAAPPVAQLIASGTSPKELATGAGALKLAKTWDKLGLWASEIEGKTVAPDVGWVRATVLWPRPGATNAVRMGLTAVVVRHGDAWRWVSLQFVAPDD